MQNSRDNSIDSLRGIACLIVLLTHIWTSVISKYYSGADIYYAFYGIGKFAVCIFFVLSAYFAYAKVGCQLDKYFVKKLLRVYIPFFFATVFGWMLGWIDTKESLINFWDLTIVSGHLWTVVVEIKFYFIFIIFLAFVHKFGLKQKHIILLLALISMVCIIIFPPTKWPDNDQGLQWYIPIFSLGIIISIVQQNIKINKHKYRRICDIVFVIVSILLFIRIPIVRQMIWHIPMDKSLLNKYLEFGLAAGILLFCILNGEFIKKVLEKLKIIQIIGRYSYSIYLMHYIIFWKLKLYSMNMVTYLILCIILTIVCSVLFYEFIEKRFTKYLIDIVINKTKIDKCISKKSEI